MQLEIENKTALERMEAHEKIALLAINSFFSFFEEALEAAMKAKIIKVMEKINAS